MQDDTLGPAVDVGSYTGPLLKGEPLHDGSCTDGVHGCTLCNAGARRLSDEQLASIGWTNSSVCDWCHTSVPFNKSRGVRPWDEGGHVYYEVCLACYSKYQKELAQEDAYDRDRYGDDDVD